MVESAAVTQFYLAVAEASHNVVLLHLLRAMGPMLEQNILRNNEILNRRPGVVAKIRRHRASLIEAILSGVLRSRPGLLVMSTWPLSRTPCWICRGKTAGSSDPCVGSVSGKLIPQGLNCRMLAPFAVQCRAITTT